MTKKNSKRGELLIQAALRLFIQKGYHATTIDNITKASGITKGGLYAHFSSKNELLHKILGKYKLEFLDELKRRTNEYEGNAIEKLNYVISFNAGFALENFDLILFLTYLSQELSSDPDFEFVFKSLYREYQQFVNELLQQGIRQGLIRKDLNPNLMALFFMAIHDGVLHHWILNRNNISGQEYVETLRQVFIKGIMP